VDDADDGAERAGVGGFLGREVHWGHAVHSIRAMLSGGRRGCKENGAVLENAQGAGAAFDAVSGLEGAVFMRTCGDAAVEFEGEAVALFFDAIDAGIDGIVIEPEMDFLTVGVGDGPLQGGFVGTVGDLEFVCHVEPSA
ncbi:MAG: hypothetical protein ACXW28_15375, partial [Thermoanaerobaculia bacterium]